MVTTQTWGGRSLVSPKKRGKTPKKRSWRKKEKGKRRCMTRKGEPISFLWRCHHHESCNQGGSRAQGGGYLICQGGERVHQTPVCLCCQVATHVLFKNRPGRAPLLVSPYLALDKILTLLQWKKEDLGELVLSLPNWWAPLRSCAGGLASRAFLFLLPSQR